MYKQIPLSVFRMFKVSSTAKFLYGVFINSLDNGCINLEYTIAITQMSERSIRTYINELIKYNFIKKSSRKNRKMSYTIVPIEEVHFLRTSEFIHSLCDKYKERYTEQSCFLCANILSNKVDYRIELCVDTQKMLEKYFTELLEKKGDKVFIPKNAKVTPTASQITPHLKPKQSNYYKEKVVGEWNHANFLQYFYDCYYARYKEKHAQNQKIHYSMMKRFCDLYETNQQIKAHIDAFFTLELQQHSVNYLCQSNMIEHVRCFVRDGTIPFFLKQSNQNTKSKIETIEEKEVREQSAEDLKKQLEGIWGEY